MNKWEDDIRRYHTGEMSPQEQHALEKKALSDPFLAEALEGAEFVSPTEFSADMNELSSKIEQAQKTNTEFRVAKSSVAFATEASIRTETEKKTHSRWIWPLRIAASVAVIALVFFTITPLFENEKQLALQSPKPEEKQLQESISPDISETKTDQLIKKPEAKGTEKSESIPEKKEPVKPTEEVLDLPSGAAAPALADRGEQEKEKISTAEEADLISESQPVAETIQPESKKEASQVARSKGISLSIATNQKVINGQVISAEDGTPLPGVNVVIKGTSIGTVTDIHGNYQVISDSPEPILAFSFYGMKTQEVKVKDQSTVSVQLQSDLSQLSEIIVTGYSPMKDRVNLKPIVKLAEPVGGRAAFDKYLKRSLQYPQQALDNQIKGRVTIKFTVRTDGSLDEFSVLKGLGYGCDEEVIRLVKEGPAWLPTTEDDAPVKTEVQVRVKFAPQD